MNLALDGLPNFKSLPGPGAHLRGAISISPSVDYMERAYDEAKYGRFSRRPYIDMVIPSLTDPSVAPPGKHVMSCFVQYAPYNLKEGNWDEKRDEFGDTVIDTIAEHAPNIKDLILHRQVLTPLDLERDFGLSEGNIFQGELTLEQLFFLRPAPGWAQYRTPIKNLYMCGSATHPGGGIMGAPGRNAAMQMLKDLECQLNWIWLEIRSKSESAIGLIDNDCTTSPSSAVVTTVSWPPVISRRADLKTLVLERREIVGGGAVTEEIHPGFPLLDVGPCRRSAFASSRRRSQSLALRTRNDHSGSARARTLA